MPQTPGAGLPPNLRPDLAWLAEKVVPASAVFGALLSVVVPGEYWLRINNISLSYTSNATVGVRLPTLVLRDSDGNVQMVLPANAGQDANRTLFYDWFPGCGAAIGALNSHQVGPWPDMYLPTGWSLGAFAGNPFAGDTIGPFSVYAEFIPTGPELPKASLMAIPAIA